MPQDHTLRRIVDFIRSIGIEVNEGAMTRETLVPGMDIVHGTLLVDETIMCKPADLLHEAAHIALTAPAARNALDGTAGTSPAEEVSAIAWTWAASRHLDIDPPRPFTSTSSAATVRRFWKTFWNDVTSASRCCSTGG